MANSKTKREARFRHVIPKWEDANVTVISQTISVRMNANT